VKVNGEEEPLINCFVVFTKFFAVTWRNCRDFWLGLAMLVGVHVGLIVLRIVFLHLFTFFAYVFHECLRRIPERVVLSSLHNNVERDPGYTLTAHHPFPSPNKNTQQSISRLLRVIFMS
jgi:hypothetical protein